MVQSAPFLFQLMDPTTLPSLKLRWKPFMPLHPPLPPHIIFHLDSPYVIDLLLGLSIPCANIQLAILVLDLYHHVTSQTHVELRKAQSHTGIPGHDRADLKAFKGISSHTPIGRFSSFPPHALPTPPRLDIPTSALDSLKVVQNYRLHR